MSAVQKDIDVFVSYSNKDKAVADGLVVCLESNGLRCWYAPRDIAPGANWAGSIMDAIERSRVFVLIFSDNSSQSHQVLNEVTNAFNKGCTIMPFKIKATEVEGDLSYYLASVHWLDAVRPPMKDRYNELAEQILHVLGRDVPPTLAQRLAQRREKDAKRNASGRKKLPKAAIIGILIAVLAVIAAAAFVVLGSGSSSQSEEETEIAAAEETEETEEAAEEEPEEEEPAEEAAEEIEEEEEEPAEETEEEADEAEEIDASLVSEEGYLLSAEAIPDSVFDEMSAEIEDTFTAYVASDWDSDLVTLRGFDCIGFYFLTEKDSASPHNRIYFVYQVNAEYFTEDSSGLTDTMVTYYYYGGYDNLRVSEDSSLSAEYDDLFTVGETFEDHGLTYKGWQNLDDMYSELVTTRVDTYSCENHVEDEDFGYEPTELASYTGIPDDAVEFNGHYYKLYDVGGAIGWEDAKERCENLGGHLVTVTSSAEQEFLETNILDSGGYTWMAGYYSEDGIWLWDTEELMVYTDWTQPDKTTAAEYRYLGFAGYSWYYFDETGYTYKSGNRQVTGYVCEWEPEDSEEEDLSRGIDGAAIPDDATTHDGHYYRIYKAEDGLTWSEAEALCETLGGHLLTVTSAEEQEYLEINVYKTDAYYFIGGYYNTEGEWVWVTGETMGYMQWSLPSQENSTTYRYMGVAGTSWYYFSETGTTYKSGNRQTSGYICEWESGWDPDAQEETESTAEDGEAAVSIVIPDDAIEYSGHSYRIYGTSSDLTWSEAEALCENLGGHLLTVTSAEEQKFLEINVYKSDSNYLIGGYYNTEGEWVWVTGETMSYMQWDLPSQENSTKYRYMGVLGTSWYYFTETGETYKSGNRQTSGFICEWDTTADAAAASDETADTDAETQETQETETASTYAE